MSEKCKFHPIAPSPRCRICKSDPPPSDPLPPPSLKKPDSRHGLMPIWGDKKTWNLSSLMRKNVFSSVYFNKSLFHLRDLSSVLDEIPKHVESIEPWIKNTCNSTTSFFCILVKLFILKLTEGQLRFILDSKNLFTKAIGVLYIRFLADPAELWDRLKDLSLCTEKLPNHDLTVSELISQVLSTQDYFGLQLPRIPAKLQGLINQRIVEIPQRIERFLKNLEKVFEKDSDVYLYSGEPVKVMFKAKDGCKVHIQKEGKDFHVHLADVDEEYVAPQRCLGNGEQVFAEHRSEYSKRSESYSESLIFKIPEKRGRSPEPTSVMAVAKPKLEKVFLPSKAVAEIDDFSEIFKLG